MSEEHNARMPVKFCGIVLGTASGWDQVADEVLHFYDFTSSRSDLPNAVGGISIDYLNGRIEFYDDAGNVDWTFTMHLTISK